MGIEFSAHNSFFRPNKAPKCFDTIYVSDSKSDGESISIKTFDVISIPDVAESKMADVEKIKYIKNCALRRICRFS